MKLLHLLQNFRSYWRRQQVFMLYSQLHITSYSLVWFWVLLLLLLRLAFIHPVIKSPFQTLRDISLGRRVELKSPAPA